MADDDNVGYRRGQSSADCTCISLLLTACLAAGRKYVENGFKNSGIVRLFKTVFAD